MRRGVALACAIFWGFFVLLVPASASWADTVQPRSSAWSSLSAGSPLVSLSGETSPTPTPSGESTTEPGSEPTSEPTPEPPAQPTPEPTPGTTAEPSPEPTPDPSPGACTRESPCVVEPSRDWLTFQTLLGAVTCVGVMGLLVRSFG